MDQMAGRLGYSELAVNLRAVRWFYFMAGIGMAAWAILVPYSKIRFGLDDGTLGLILLAGGTGGVIALPFCGPAVVRFGSRAVLTWAGGTFGIVLPLMGLAPSVLAFAVLLFVFGMAFAAVDVAMNAQAAVIEARTGARHMSFFHALFSIGGLAVALATSLLLRLGVPNPVCAILYGAAVLLILTQRRFLVSKEDDLPAGGPKFAWPNRATLVLGLCCLACFLTEGAVTDWSTIFLRFSRGLNLSEASLGFAAFSVAMAATRLAGDRIATWLGGPMVMRLGCGLAVAGFALAILLPFGIAGIIGFGLVGLGMGNIAPLVFSAAAQVPGMAASHSVPAVVGLGYVGFLLGPVVIGQVAHFVGLNVALGMDALLLCAIGFAAGAVRR
jgi:MFS family permease